jgi:phosphoribosylformylglycinamidine (FGAM) synthase-like amidotransferase family enzyme
MSEALAEFPDLTRAETSKVRVLVLTGYGLNCEAETGAGFEMLGANVDRVHASELLEGRCRLADYQLLAFIGGFSFGDHVASGRVYANRLRYRAGEAIARFVDDGGLALGMCNGFQTMVKMGLIPAVGRVRGGGLANQSVSVVGNERLGYRNAWVRMAVDPESPCVFTRGLEFIECPSRHGEGQLVFQDDAQRAALEAAHLVPLRYVDADGEPTEGWPENPNGSPGGVAALCDPSGRLFGLMPHPEAYLYPESHPRWIAQRDAGTLPAVGVGLRLLANGVRAALSG